MVLDAFLKVVRCVFKLFPPFGVLALEAVESVATIFLEKVQRKFFIEQIKNSKKNVRVLSVAKIGGEELEVG